MQKLIANKPSAVKSAPAPHTHCVQCKDTVLKQGDVMESRDPQHQVNTWACLCFYIRCFYIIFSW